LTQSGCDYGQGYLFSRPFPKDQFKTFLDRPQA
jgi:EAL domain-containing protein (putative c-di-GMP-specific phosphodiesterase class I)